MFSSLKHVSFEIYFYISRIQYCTFAVADGPRHPSISSFLLFSPSFLGPFCAALEAVSSSHSSLQRLGLARGSAPGYKRVTVPTVPSRCILRGADVTFCKIRALHSWIGPGDVGGMLTNFASSPRVNVP